MQTMELEKDTRRGIQSIEVGGALLQTLVRFGTPMMLKDLAREAGMPPAKAHPYLVSFGKLGLIEQDSVTGLYKLGSFALQMGLTALHELDAIKVASDQAAVLALTCQQNVALAVWGNHGPTVVRIQECNRIVHINMRTGSVMSLLDSATGRVFAAYLPAHLTAELLQQELAHKPAAQRPDVAAMLDEVRRRRCSTTAASWRWSSPRWARRRSSTRTGMACWQTSCATVRPMSPRCWGIAAELRQRWPQRV